MKSNLPICSRHDLRHVAHDLRSGGVCPLCVAEARTKSEQAGEPRYSPEHELGLRVLEILRDPVSLYSLSSRMRDIRIAAIIRGLLPADAKEARP